MRRLSWIALTAAALAVIASMLAVAAARSASYAEAVAVGAFVGVALGMLPWLLIRIARMARGR